MTIGDWLRTATNQLNDAGIATGRLDCLVLLEDALGYDRAWLLSHPEQELQRSELKKLNTKIVQRVQHIPLAYIRGHAEFYGREFAVNEHTLVPRPETETMLDMLKRIRNMEADVAVFQVERRGRKPVKKQYAFEKQPPASSLVRTETGYKVVWQKPKRAAFNQPRPPISGQNLRYHDEDFYLYDIGTGSGAIAITAKLETPVATVAAIDIDSKCLEIAKRNARELGADVSFLQGDLVAPLSVQWPTDDQAVTILLCNLPYVPNEFHINTAATHEPRHALFGGPDGLDLYRRMFAQLGSNDLQPHYILAESLPPQHKELSRIAAASGYHLQETDDFIQLFSY
jgi:methylase of polypeptide subunit release factors